MNKSATVRVHRRHANAKVDPGIAVTLYQEGKSLRTIARELGVSRMAVARAIHYANISLPPKNSAVPS
jgi:DNA-binding transcriptional regulator LsrR (DeoR family)